MPKAYWVAHATVTEPEAYGAYVAAASAAFAKHGAKILARGGTVDHLEGAGRPRNIVIEFESLEAARACFHSDDYQAAKALRAGAGLIDLCLLEGV
jgi:uncharacterized protein (DUF1330 family)